MPLPFELALKRLFASAGEAHARAPNGPHFDNLGPASARPREGTCAHIARSWRIARAPSPLAVPAEGQRFRVLREAARVDRYSRPRVRTVFFFGGIMVP